MLSFDHGDVNLSIGDENYVTTLTSRSAQGPGRGTYWRKFPVSEYWLTRIRKLPHLEFLKEVERAYEFLLALPEGSLFVDTVHLVLAMLREGENAAAQLLFNAGLTVEKFIAAGTQGGSSGSSDSSESGDSSDTSDTSESSPSRTEGQNGKAQKTPTDVNAPCQTVRSSVSE